MFIRLFVLRRKAASYAFINCCQQKALSCSFAKSNTASKNKRIQKAQHLYIPWGITRWASRGWRELQLLAKPVILETAKGKQNRSTADYSSVSSLAETVAQRSSISKHYVLNCNRTA